MIERRIVSATLIAGLLFGGVWGAITLLQQRMARCAYVPLLAENILPNADLSQHGHDTQMPTGWVAAAPGAMPGDFALDGDQRSLHLMGIANFIQTPPVPVAPGRSYCFSGYAITDSAKGSPTQVRLRFQWRNAQGDVVAEDDSAWQPVVLWQEDAPPDQWSHLAAAFRAPPDAATLHVQMHPASDDRIYLDVMHVRPGGAAPERVALAANPPELLTVRPWPDGHRAALSFTFDWETTMAGLIHSRSVGDPYTDTDPLVRGLRMREGVTTTLNLFEPHQIRATYYSAGYTFLLSNTTRMQFMDNPTYTWATTENRWTTDRWTTTPWFAPDPYGTVQSHPAWYFGDLVPRLQAAGQDIQSHTFSHFYGGFVGAEEWRDDLATWRRVAAARGVAPARSLAFPWSSSGGMSYADWDALEAAGITSVTRLSDQSQYNLFPRDEHGLVNEPHCIPLPGHERILACPDIYLTPASVGRVLQQIERTREEEGFIDVWAHTEEVISAEQQAAWQQVVAYAAAQPDVWIAPLSEVADWQQAAAQVQVQAQPGTSSPHTFTVTNASDRPLSGLTIQSAVALERATVEGTPVPVDGETGTMLLDMEPQQRVEVALWPAP